MSVFEAVMLLCFASAWPASIYKSYRSRTNRGKSLVFLAVVFTGYVSGSVHKFLYSFDAVTALYLLNAVMVFADICLYWRNSVLMSRCTESM